MTTEPVDLLSRALDQTKRAIAGVRPEQATNPTPCDSWDVQTLVAHLVHDLDNFTVRARGGNPDWTAATPTLDRDWTDAFGQGADQLLDDWRAAGDLSGTIEAPGMGELPARFPVDQQVAEFATHTWDLMTATDQHLDLDPEVGRAALDWARGALQPAFRGAESEGKAFGPRGTRARGRTGLRAARRLLRPPTALSRRIGHTRWPGGLTGPRRGHPPGRSGTPLRRSPG